MAWRLTFLRGKTGFSSWCGPGMTRLKIWRLITSLSIRVGFLQIMIPAVWKRWNKQRGELRRPCQVSFKAIFGFHKMPGWILITDWFPIFPQEAPAPNLLYMLRIEEGPGKKSAHGF